MPTFDQIRGTFVLDRIFGSRSLATYSWVEAKSQSFLTDMELQAYCRAIYAMYMKIEDAMDNGKCMEWPVVSSIPEVRTVAIRSEGQTVVLAVNISKDKQADASFRTEAKSATDFMDDAWAYTIEDKTLKLSLPPNGTAILLLKD